MSEPDDYLNAAISRAWEKIGELGYSRAFFESIICYERTKVSVSSFVGVARAWSIRPANTTNRAKLSDALEALTYAFTDAHDFWQSAGQPRGEKVAYSYAPEWFRNATRLDEHEIAKRIMGSTEIN